MSEQRIPRTRFEEILRGVLSLLGQRYMFASRVPQQVRDPVAEVFETTFSRWFGEVEPQPATPSQPKANIGLSKDQFNTLTLQCALIFVRQGIQGVDCNESLNAIRDLLISILEAMGFEDSENIYRDHTDWGTHPLWQEVVGSKKQ